MTDDARTIHQIIYVSSAAQPFSEGELEALLAKSRDNNRELGVTGLLVALDGRFFQIIEGARELVTELYEKIEQDPRHHEIVKIYALDSVRRTFSDWEMALVDQSPSKADERSLASLRGDVDLGALIAAETAVSVFISGFLDQWIGADERLTA